MSQELKYYLDQKPLSFSELESMKKAKKKFTDELFLPNEFSLLSQDDKGFFLDSNLGEKIAIKFLKKLKYLPKWMRLSEMPEFNKMYDKKNFSFEIILQGSIGDCYLISELCEISQYPKLLINDDNLENSINIINKYDREVGYYEIKLFIDGEYQIVILDDYIPYDENYEDISFAKTSKNYYWVCLVEKAFAKVLGGYSNIINIDDEDDEDFKKFKICNKTNLAFSILTGFLPEKYSFKDYDKDFIYKKIYNEGLYQANTTKNEILITTGSISEDEGILEENYIPYNHSFSVLDIKTIFIDSQEIKLLLLNNPWGKNVFNSNMIGNYLQNTKNDKMKDINKYIQYNIDSQNGTFWIDFDTFFESFTYVSLCKILTNAKIYIYKFDKEIYYQKPFLFNLKILENETDVFLSIFYERNKYDKKNEEKRMNFYLILNEVNDSNEVIESYSKSDIKEIYINKLLNKGNYHIWIYTPNNIEDKSSFKIAFNKNININFNKFDDDFKYIHQICKESALIKKGKTDQKNEFDVIDGYNIIDGFYITLIKNKIRDSFKFECNIETKGDVKMITKGFQKIGNNKNKINDTLNPYDIKIYIIIIKDKNTSVTKSYTYLKGSKGNLNTLTVKDYTYYNFNKSNESNNIIEGIKFMQFNTPKHKKIHSKIYEILNSYDDDNLIKGLNNDIGNKNRQVRAINDFNNIHSFGEFKNSYQNKTYTNENIHGFVNKKNKKLEIKEEKNKFFYLKNENNSKMNFSLRNENENESIFNNKNNQIEELPKKENEELNDFSLISKFIDYMELVEKKENPNISYMEVRRKYSKIWNELNDEDKMVYALFFEIEKNNKVNIKNII